MTPITLRRVSSFTRATILALVSLALLSANAAADTTVNLIAAPLTKTIALPNGSAVDVPMWGFAMDLNGDAVLDPDEVPTVPGPPIVVPPGTSSLTINLKNLLPEPVSIVVPGQQASGSPVVVGGRIRSMAPEATPGGAAAYTFTNLRPGTYLYHSGSHLAVQVQMGLYGALTQNVAAGQAYDGGGYAFDHEVLLLYSEIDVGLHDAVATNTYGTPSGPTSTIDYAPSLFLVNGESYTAGLAPIPAGAVGERTLIRMLNAGLDTHVVVLDNAGELSLVAEDGNPYADPRAQASILLPAGKTHDAFWSPAAAGDYSVYDRTLRLEALAQPVAGMLAKLHIDEDDGSGPSSSSAVAAIADAYPAAEDTPLIAAAPGVLGNDTGATTAEPYSVPAHGTLSLDADGGFTYTPQANFSGVDSFWYRASNGSDIGAPTLVTIDVAPTQDPPLAFPLALGLNAGGSKPITVTGVDPDGDAVTLYVSQLPDAVHGTLMAGDQVLTAADLYGGVTPLAIPHGKLTYVALSTGTGQDSFTFVASDGALASTEATVSLTIHESQSTAAVGDPIALSVLGLDPKDPNAAPVAVSAYTWTLEEDRTYQVQPGVLDPNTIAVGFYRSYMPVVQSGDQNSQPRLEAGKRYFISVLPKAGGYSSGGAPIAAGQIAVTVYTNVLPLPTAQIRVRVFEDNSPLNGQYDTDESPLVGFHVYLDDTGGRYGIAGGQIMQDAFGNPIGTTYQACSAPSCTDYEVDQRGNGFLVTDSEGFVTFKNLRAGKYTAKVIPPSGEEWQQTTTIEGQKGQDAWVKPNEPTFFSEFGPAGPHVEIGFIRPIPQVVTASNGPFSSVTGTITNLHQSRPPDVHMFSGGPFDFTRPWVGLNDGVDGSAIYAAPTNEDGTFSIEGVPSGSYTLAIWDSALDIIWAEKTVTVDANANATTALGDIPVFSWFTRLYHYVFEDMNKNGQRDPGERGIREVPLNTRWRDATIYSSSATDGSGFLPFEETFPFFSWQIAEVDYGRFRATGVTAVVDNGGDVNADSTWSDDVGAEADSRVLAPQPQVRLGSWRDNEDVSYAARARTEAGPALLEGFQGFVGQTNLFLWGKAPYDVPGSHAVDVNASPFDDFPGPGDVDHNGNGRFDIDEFNGGITGIVHYSTTRAENNARWGTPEVWEPGIPGVTVQLWDASRTYLLNEVSTDSWDDSIPTGCQGDVFTYLGQPTDCYDGMRNWNQVRPAVFDGGYAFYTIHQDDVDHATFDLPFDQRTAERPLPAGKYIVKVVVPEGYSLVKEEDKNVDFGDEYIPQEFYVDGYPLADAGDPGDPPPRERAFEDPLYAPFCVGELHELPAELALFPGVPNTYAGDEMPLCDEKLLTVRDATNAAANFFLFTEAPVAGHITGFVLDDTANETDPNSPQFGEKYAPPWLPVSIRDWTGREITHTYTDRYGVYNALVPSTYSASAPIPSGMTPNLLIACINSAVMTDANGNLVPDPFHNKQYSQFCYTLQYMPGTTTHLDTPVLPTGAFAGPGQTALDAELPDKTPVVYSVNGPGNIGPYVVDGGGASAPATRTITITSQGATQVPNPAFDPNLPNGAGNPQTIARDYGFGATEGQVWVGSTLLPAAGVTWSDATISAVVPSGTPTGQLRVVRCLDGTCSSVRESVLGVTLTVASSLFHAMRPPLVVAPGQRIQSVIDSAAPGDLILVRPGTHEELVVMDKPVRLQGWGAASTIINAVKAPAEKLQAWRDRIATTLTATPDYLLAFQAAELATGFDQIGELLGPTLGGEGAAITVLARNLPLLGMTCPQTVRPMTPQAYGLQVESGGVRAKARIDGFGITGSDQAAGIEVNANACNLEITNNRIYGNMGDFGSAIRIGHPGAVTELADDPAHNEHVSIAYNHVLENSSLQYDGGGAIAIGSGADGYTVQRNFVAGNFTLGRGAGIAHLGLSDHGTIDHNTVVFNEVFNPDMARMGGGIYVGGRPPGAAELTPGSGNVVVSGNLVQGNAAIGDGGGIALVSVNGQELASTGTPYQVRLFGNVVVDNVAGLGGGGIALQDAIDVRIDHDTIAHNDSLSVAGAAFLNGPNVSRPHPAGILTRANSPQLQAALPTSSATYSNPSVANSIIWQNRSFYYGPCDTDADPLCGTRQLGQGDPTQYALIPLSTTTSVPDFPVPIPGTAYDATWGYWDVGILGASSSDKVSASYSVLTDLGGVAGGNNTTTTPAFVTPYFNGDRKQTMQTPDVATAIQVPAVFDEGGNFIRPMFGPLSLYQIVAGEMTDDLSGDYHVTNYAALTGAPLYTGQISAVPGLYPNLGAVPAGLTTDRDGDLRTASGLYPTRGEDQNPPPPAVSVGDATVAEGNAGTTALAFAVTLSRPAASPIDIRYFTANGSGSNGAIGGAAACAPGVNACDFVTIANAPANIVTFAPTETVKYVNVTVTGDAIYEPDQTLLLTIALAPGETDATMADAQGTGTIQNDDAIPALSINDVTQQEPAGAFGSTANMNFTITLTGAHEQPSGVIWSTANGTASGGLLALPSGPADYLIRLLQSVTFAATATASQTATAAVPIVRNNVSEPASERFFVNLNTIPLFSPTNASIFDSQGVGTITNRP